MAEVARRDDHKVIARESGSGLAAFNLQVTDGCGCSADSNIESLGIRRGELHSRQPCRITRQTEQGRRTRRDSLARERVDDMMLTRGGVE